MTETTNPPRLTLVTSLDRRTPLVEVDIVDTALKDLRGMWRLYHLRASARAQVATVTWPAARQPVAVPSMRVAA